MSKYLPDRLTDEELAGLEARIKQVYKQAEEELDIKARKYLDKFAERYEKEFAAWQDGKYTDAQFKAWVQSQTERGKRWLEMRNNMAQRLTHANEVASSYINDTTPGIYSLNHNFESYVMETAHMGVSFTLYDEQTVKRLITEKRLRILPITEIDTLRDINWNETKLQKELTQGILQGESVNKIAKRFQKVTNMNYNSAVQSARTAVTSAQNAGRQAAYQQAYQMGIDVTKKWMSTKDSRTRRSHQELDGETQPYAMSFTNGLMYPGDMNGDPSEYCNCRCTMCTVDAAAVTPKKVRVRGVDGQNVVVDEMNYKEWLKWKSKSK
jgi:SPP1 gp7 family putative phage head morphogenesis protein